MDRNLAGETSHRFSPTLTEAASVELSNLRGRIDQIVVDLQTHKTHTVTLENNVKADIDVINQARYYDLQTIDKNIHSIESDIQVIGNLIFRVLTLLPIRVLNWFNCFAELTVCKSTSDSSGKDVHPVLIVLRPLNMSPNIDKKTIRALNKISYKSLAEIKKNEKRPEFKIILSMF